jgi:hypothetical protein
MLIAGALGGIKRNFAKKQGKGFDEDNVDKRED